jgi:hypothetical protein
MHSGDEFILRERLSVGTVINLSENKLCTPLVRNEETDNGLQALGQVKKMQDLAFFEEYELGKKEKYALPQVLWKIHITVDKFLDFKYAPKDKGCPETY